MQEFFLPRFALEGWPNRGAAQPGRLKTIQWADAQIVAGDKYRSLRGDEFALRVESTPSAWAHAETFYNVWLKEVAKPEDFDPQGEAFQHWGGLLAALFWGDLVSVRYSKADLAAMDEDLPPALEMSLPFELSIVNDPKVRSMHDNGSLTLLRTSAKRGSAVLGVGFASSLVASVAEQPNLGEDEKLQKFVDPASEELSIALDHLIHRYSTAPGFIAAFVGTVRDLRNRTKSETHPEIATSLERLADYAATFRQKGDAQVSAADDYRDPSDDWFGFRYRQPEYSGEELWSKYPLQSTGRDGRKIIFVAEGIDPALNAWSEQRAFPGTQDSTTRLCDLTILESQDGRVRLQGQAGHTYTTSVDHRVVRLGPGPADAHTIFQSNVFVLTGPNSIRSSHVDSVHQKWGSALEPNRDATALLPLHRQFFEFFPEKLRGSLADELRYQAGALADGMGTFSWDLPGDAESETRVAFSLSVLEWTSRETSPPSIDLWPGLRWVKEGAYFLRSFRRGGSEMDLAVHGERGLGSGVGLFEKDHEKSGYVVTSLNGPPAVAEFLFRGAPHGVLKLSLALPQTMPKPASQWEVAVDFGTSNTSVARKAADERKTQTVKFRPLSVTLWRSKKDEEEPPLAGVFLPGWFLEGDQNYHRGFFATLIAYRHSLFQPEASGDGQSLLDRLEKVGTLSADVLHQLVGGVDLLGLYGADGLVIEEEHGGVWGVEDELKWAKVDRGRGQADVSDRLRKALRTAFLSRLLMQTCAQAIKATGNLPSNYSFTYPLSMARREVDDYGTLVNHAVAAVESLFTGATVDPGEVGVKVKLVNESQAVFQAYLEAREVQKLTSGSRVVLIDVGGGSADYAVFTKDGICFLDSLRLAGNRFFEFIRDSCDHDPHFEQLADQIDFMTDSAWTRSRDLKGNENLTPAFRRFYNLTVSSMMPGKSNRDVLGADAIGLNERESRVGEDVFKQKASNPTFHWKRSMFKSVLGHGLLLGMAPVESQPRVETLNLVLAGNGWGLLCYGGVRKNAKKGEDDALSSLVAEVLDTIEGFGGHCGRDEIAKFRTQGEVEVHFMDDLVKRAAAGQGVYSKDLVAIGGLASVPKTGADESILRSSPLGISVKARQGDREFELPWNLPLSPQALKAFAETNDLILPSGSAFFGGQAGVAMEIMDMSFPIPGSDGATVAVPEQILALALFQRGDQLRVGLSRDDLAGWSEGVRERAAAALEYLQGAGEDKLADRTSLIRAVWEYCVDGQGRRESLFSGGE